MWDTGGDATLECIVRNTGDRAGAEVVQLYVRDPVAQRHPADAASCSASPASSSAPGAAARVAFEVSAERLALVSWDLHWHVEPGAFDLTVARSAADPG